MKKTRLLLNTAVLLLWIGLIVPCEAQDQTSPAAGPAERARWAAEAKNVTIVRDDWGIAHVYGETDADAVFGMIYAQAEDDFNRVETNYLNAMGRLAEAEGEGKLYQDLRMKLFIDPERVEEAVRGQSGVAAEADGCLRRRAQLLPRETSRGEAESDPTLRALDGAIVHRRQHRGRHRSRRPQEVRSFLRRTRQYEGHGL